MVTILDHSLQGRVLKTGSAVRLSHRLGRERLIAKDIFDRPKGMGQACRHRRRALLIGLSALRCGQRLSERAIHATPVVDSHRPSAVGITRFRPTSKGQRLANTEGVHSSGSAVATFDSAGTGLVITQAVQFALQALLATMCELNRHLDKPFPLVPFDDAHMRLTPPNAVTKVGWSTPTTVALWLVWRAEGLGEEGLVAVFSIRGENNTLRIRHSRCRASQHLLYQCFIALAYSGLRKE